jgi:hypothetical protein
VGNWWGGPMVNNSGTGSGRLNGEITEGENEMNLQKMTKEKSAQRAEALGVNGGQAIPENDYSIIQEFIKAKEKLLGAFPKRRAELNSLLDRLAKDELKEPGGDPAVLEALMSAIRTIDSSILLKKEFDPVPWIVPDYLPPGLTIISGKPKVGKSWLALQLALSVMTGGMAFEKQVNQGKVLYLALEDSERRLKDRMKKQDWPSIHGKVDFMLYGDFFDQIGSLNSGGGIRLMQYIEAEKFSLVIVDTFSRAIKGDQLDSSEMTAAVGPIQQKALELDIALVLVDHMRKNTGVVPDPISDVFGSVAKAGILDTAWALYKEQGVFGAKLAISGRDVDTYDLQLEFRRPGYFWHCHGEALTVYLTQERQNILDALEDLEEANNRRIAEYIKSDESNTRKKLNDLCNEGLIEIVEKNGQKLYRLTKD